MKDSVISTTVSLIFMDNARMVWNFPYSRTYLLGTRDFTLKELEKFGDDLTTKDFVKTSCFSDIDFTYTLNIEKSNIRQKSLEKSEALIFVTRKNSKHFKCGATSVSDCAYKIKKGLCPRKHVHWKLFETFQKERD